MLGGQPLVLCAHLHTKKYVHVSSENTTRFMYKYDYRPERNFRQRKTQN